MANIAVDQIIEVTFKGECLEQEIMSKFHYRVTVTPGGPVPQEELATNLDLLLAGVGNLYQVMKLCLPSNWNASDNSYQVIEPTRYVAYRKSHEGESGLNTFATLTANVAVCLTKRGDFAGRKFISTTHLLGTTDDNFIDDGRITPLAAAALDILGIQMKESLTVAVDAGDVELVPMIYHPNEATLASKGTPITSVLTQQSVRVMRRRTLGIGS